MSDNVRGGFKADPITMEEMRKKLIEVRDYFQQQVRTKQDLKTGLDRSFYDGHAGETGAFQRRYQEFGHTWTGYFEKMLILDQRFVDLINEHGEMVRQAAALYAQADETARLTLQRILDDIG